MNRLHVVLATGVVVLVASMLAMPTPSTPAQAPAHDSPSEFVVRDVRLFDGERFHERRSVHVRAGRIVDVGELLPVPDGIAVVDGVGRTLMPGLIDAHVHTWGTARRDALRFGVTTMLDMFSDPRGLKAARAERAALDATDRADLWSAGTLATVAGGHGTQYGVAVPTLSTPGEAPAWVDARLAEGSDYIKIVREDLHVYSHADALPTLDAGTAAALVAAAHSRGVRAVVHASAQEAARESLRDGADGLVHVFQDAVADDAFVALARERRAFVVPTLTVVAGFSGERTRVMDDPRVSPWLSDEQRQTLAGRGFTGAQPALLENALQSVRRLQAAGVPVLAGTDAPNANTAHGVSLHEEMAWLAKAGLTPAQALAAATSEPADAFGLDDRGRIAAGLRADLVLVKGDLSQDLDQTLAILTIWKNGRAVDRRVEINSAPVLATGMLGDFDAPEGQGDIGRHWVPTSDRMAGGQSEAALARIPGGANGSAGALRVSGRVHTGGPQVWAGAFLSPGEGVMQALDARALADLVFQVRSDDARPLTVMLFSGGEGAAPATVDVAPGPQWREVRLRLADFPGADPGRLRAVAFTVRAPAGEFAFDLDQVEIR